MPNNPDSKKRTFEALYSSLSIAGKAEIVALIIATRVREQTRPKKIRKYTFAKRPIVLGD